MMSRVWVVSRSRNWLPLPPWVTFTSRTVPAPTPKAGAVACMAVGEDVNGSPVIASTNTCAS